MCVPGTLTAVLAAPVNFPTPAGPPPRPEPAFVAQLRSAPPRRLVDLTHRLTRDFPTFDGSPAIELTPTEDYAREGYFSGQIRHHEHVGTHLDAPVHFIAGGRSVDALALEDLVVPAVVIDLRARAASAPDTQLTLEDLKVFEATHGPIPRSAAVLLWSGWDTHVGDPLRYRNVDARGHMRFPGFHPEAASYLHEERGARGLGVDTLSLDHGSSQDFATHRAWLRSGGWGLENLTRLGDLPPTGAVLMVGAPKVGGGSGGPTRVLALVP